MSFVPITSHPCVSRGFVSSSRIRYQENNRVRYHRSYMSKEGTAPVTAPSSSTSSSSSSSSSRTPWKGSVFPSWQTSRVTARGDYVQDLSLEIDGPLYSLQKDLPQLPLSDIPDTMERLLPTVLPLAQTELERQNFLRATETFSQQAKPFQERLIERQQQAIVMHTSWLQSLWQSIIYLQYRNPLPHYVSYYLLVPDDDKSILQEYDDDMGAGLRRAC